MGNFLCGEIKSEREQDKAPMSILCFSLGYDLCHIFSHSVGQIKSGGEFYFSHRRFKGRVNTCE